MKGELYPYKGQMLTQAAISKLSGVNRTTLADWYKKTGDMEKAVEEAYRIRAERSIEYNGQFISLKTIANMEHLKFESLKKKYQETNDIYLAVKLTQESKIKRNGSIEYKGKMMTILGISKLENLEHHSLGRYYLQTNDIYEAVRLTKAAKDKHRGTIPYNGKIMSISGIANLEGIKHETLKEFYEIYGDIEKAVFLTKQSQLKRRKALYKGREQEYSNLAKYFGISTLQLNNLIEEGLSAEEIEKKVQNSKKRRTSEDFIMYEGDSLYRYCLNNSYNYWVINYMIKNFGKTVEEAIADYLKNGQQLPTKWIYEKYNILFKHLTLSFGLDSNRIVKIMKEENYNLEQAITRLIFVSNNDKNNMKLIEIDWLQEVYEYLVETEPSEIENTKKVLKISQKEEEFIKEKSTKIENIKRYLLLFEFAEVIDEWTLEELLEMFNYYNITDDEIKIIFTELYKPFDINIINPTVEFLKRKQYINKLILSLDNNIVDNQGVLTPEEISYIKSKQNTLNQILEARKQQKKSSKI